MSLTPNSAAERIYNGIVKENPTFVTMIGMCPTLAVTTSVINGIGMGLTTMVVLVLSNILISLLGKLSRTVCVCRATSALSRRSLRLSSFCWKRICRP
jgi:Na+-translocating ferredoxin:NAD+ oxidoreductase RnfE subunit